MLTLPNIYESKNLKKLIILPVALMLISIYISQYITLDTSLSGGVTITIPTNASVNRVAIASELSKALGIAQPSVDYSAGKISKVIVTIPNDKNLTNAEFALLSFYSYSSNYTTSNFNLTSAKFSLQANPGNATLMSAVSTASAEVNKSLDGMRTSLAAELSYLKPFVGNVSFNQTNATSMQQIAQSEYQNATNIYKQRIMTALHSAIPFTNYTYEEISPTLSRFFIGQVTGIIIWAFVLLFIAVFIIFRTLIPSLAIIFGAGNDMLIALGAMTVLKIPLGLASIAGLLMLLGYAIDTELLTSIRILKRGEGRVEERAYSAMKTGITMTSSAIVTFAVLYAVSIIAYIPTYYEIAGVVLFGLIGDIFTTWFGNAPMVMLYKKRKERI